MPQVARYALIFLSRNSTMSQILFESRQPQHKETLVESIPVKEGQKLYNKCVVCSGQKHVMLTCGICNKSITLQCARCGKGSWSEENHSSCV